MKRKDEDSREIVGRLTYDWAKVRELEKEREKYASKSFIYKGKKFGIRIAGDVARIHLLEDSHQSILREGEIILRGKELISRVRTIGKPGSLDNPYQKSFKLNQMELAFEDACEIAEGHDCHKRTLNFTDDCIP
jgi:hypothetical protein